MTSPAERFFGSIKKTRSAEFKVPGTVVGGKIVSISDEVQEREYTKPGQPPGALKFFPLEPGKKEPDPIMCLPVTVQTTLREDAEDDGQRTIWIRSEMKKVIKAVLIQAGKIMEVGGDLHVKFTHSDDPNDPRAKKYYQAHYVPPTPAAGFFGEPSGNGNGAAQTPTQSPAATQSAPPAQPAADPFPPPAAAPSWPPPQAVPAQAGAPAFDDEPPF